MWISFFNWFLAILSIIVWVGAYVCYEKEKCLAWFDNKFGKDDPMPPMPKQQQNNINIGENLDFKYNKSSETSSPNE